MSESVDIGPRLVEDAHALRALAHPVRLALVEHMTLHGPLTATEAADVVGESPSACSFHLRQLAKYGYVEETGEGSGRRRPWRMTQIGLQFNLDSDDPSIRRAGSELSSVLRERQLARYRTWRATRGSWPTPWRRAAIDTEFAFWMTPEEFEALGNELVDRMLPLMRERLAEPSIRPTGAIPVEVLILGYPIGDV
ncbi:MAG: helix-turn-helix domain-containing protein [Acidobacteria bacterium]|nr:helix-turn-helix domain-containing protein [Acidobacteriota bacterium]